MDEILFCDEISFEIYGGLPNFMILPLSIAKMWKQSLQR